MERLTDAELDEAMDVANSLHSLRLVAAVAELKGRRAADLTPEDLVHIDDARAFMVIALVQSQKARSEKGANSAARIIATLDKILGRAP